MEKLIALRGKLDAIKAMGTNAKKVALAELNEFEQSMVSMMLNPFIRFGVKKYSVAEPALENKICDEDAIQILNSLASRQLTGGSAITVIEQAVADMTEEGQDVFRRFLIKDPKAGIGISLCNKIFDNPIPVFEVQLATSYKEKGDKYPFKENPKAKFPMIASLKLDGMRVIAEVIVDEEEVNFLSRTGNPVTSLDHLKPAVLDLARMTPHKHIFFDGEATAGSFNDSISALRKKGVSAIGAVFHVFDYFLPEWKAIAKTKEYKKTGRILKDRHIDLCSWTNWKRRPDNQYKGDVRLHDFQLVHSHKEFIDLFMAALDANEEGYMAKDPISVYEFKRTKSWWKMKDEIEADGEIIGFKPGKEDSAFAHTLGSVTIRLENGVEVETSGIKHMYLDEIWNNQEKYMGRIVKVNAHEETQDGSLRHPRLKWPSCLRDTEDRIGDKE
ncbi:TPA: DNA ligase [Klebsiella quasipneumoniae subsp. similipneumoniae]|nr:DNA ligase [Klebsiella quasipneumoniae subsp. similipneumoniae]HCI6010062.1 DNA ligase [Klebsiella quasipneumoniae subsp. similipneumoniae]